MRGNARAHGARAEDYDFFDGSFHNDLVDRIQGKQAEPAPDPVYPDGGACEGYRSDNSGSTGKPSMEHLR
jgi:hypothetical protein